LKFTFGSSGCQEAKNSSTELGIFTGAVGTGLHNARMEGSASIAAAEKVSVPWGWKPFLVLNVIYKKNPQFIGV